MDERPDRERFNKIDITSAGINDQILFCPNCDFQIINAAMKPVCPDCGSNLKVTNYRSVADVQNQNWSEETGSFRVLTDTKNGNNRFYSDGTMINGYWAIRDRSTNSDEIIWIDCPEDYLSIIVEALNTNIG